ncbi:MAG TPA: hypothetical protein VNO30_37550 [Kofleriaceae bacterium]|nr:hypothetical protein [Kofleriaceae bacterium]
MSDADRATEVPPAARAAIQQALRPESDHADALPDPLPTGKVLPLKDQTKGSREVTVIRAGSDERGFYLDYYRRENDDTTSWHGRVREDGTRESLENLEGQFGIRASADPAETQRERERVHAHNARVHEVLRKKGFL